MMSSFDMVGMRWDEIVMEWDRMCIHTYHFTGFHGWKLWSEKSLFLWLYDTQVVIYCVGTSVCCWMNDACARAAWMLCMMYDVLSSVALSSSFCYGVCDVYVFIIFIHASLSLSLSPSSSDFDDRDHYGNKRMDLAGPLLGSLFRQSFAKLLKEVRLYLDKKINDGKEVSWHVMYVHVMWCCFGSIMRRVWYQHIIYFHVIGESLSCSWW